MFPDQNPNSPVKASYLIFARYKKKDEDVIIETARQDLI